MNYSMQIFIIPVLCKFNCLLYSLIKRDGLTIVPVVPWEAAPPPASSPRSTAKFFPRCVDVWRLDDD